MGSWVSARGARGTRLGTDREQVAGIFHRRRAQDAVERAGLYQPAIAHDSDTVGNLRDHAHVMGDEQHRGAVIALQVADQGEDLLLRGDVERRGRFVRNQQFGFEHQRHRDHDALALPARQPVRIGGKDALDVRQPDMLHHRQNLLAPGTGVEIGMDAQHLVDLAADRDHRVERRHRLLKNHRHPGGTQLTQPPVAGGQQFLADQLDAAAGRHQRTLLQQSHHGQRRHRFARSAFTDHAQRFAFVHLQGDAVDDAFAARLLAEADDEVVDVENDVVRSFRRHCERGVRHSGAMRSVEPGISRVGARTIRSDGSLLEAVTCRPPAVSCADRAHRVQRRRSN